MSWLPSLFTTTGVEHCWHQAHLSLFHAGPVSGQSIVDPGPLDILTSSHLNKLTALSRAEVPEEGEEEEEKKGGGGGGGGGRGGGGGGGRGYWSTSHAPLTTHLTLHPSPCTPHPSPCTLHPAPLTLQPSPCTPHPAPLTTHPSPCTPHHIASTSWCSARYLVRWSRDPVTMLTTPPGRSDVSNTCSHERGRERKGEK